MAPGATYKGANPGKTPSGGTPRCKGAGLRILFITSNRIGDAVLSTGLLGGLMERYPGATFWVACGPLAVPLFEHAPGVERIIPMKKEKRAGHWRKLLAAIMPRRWDVVVDLRGSATAWFLWAKKRYILKSDHTLHRVVHNAQVADFDPPPSPRLWHGAEDLAEAGRLIPEGRQVLAIGPTAAWPRKMWPVERYAELARRLTGPGGLMEGAYLLVSGGPGEQDICKPVFDAVPEERRIDLVGAELGLTGACFARCRLYVGNDSGLMHLAAAAGAPTLGLFGPTSDAQYGPWGERARALRGERSREQILKEEGDHFFGESAVTDITVGQVEEAAREMLARTLPGLE